MRISNDMDYNRLSEYRKVTLQNEDGSVVRRQMTASSTDKVQAQPDTGTDNGTRTILSGEDVMDFAIRGDMKSDRDLIGRDAPLENLDLKKAISDMQRDNILREYQVFVQNPKPEDGIVRRISEGKYFL